MADVTSWIPNLLGPIDLQVEGAAAGVPRRSTINLIGATVADDTANKRTNVTFSGGSGGTTFTNSAGVTPLTAYPGTVDGTKMVAWGWSTPTAPYTDYSRFEFNTSNNYWAFKNNGDTRQPIRFPTARSYWRQAAPWFVHGVFLGGDASGAVQSSLIAATAVPSLDLASAAMTYEVGDIVLKSDASSAGALEYRCTQAGTSGTLNGGATTGTITSGTTSLVVNSATGLKVGQYITIVGVSGIKKITAISGTTITIDSNASATTSSAVVAFSNPTHETVYGLYGSGAGSTLSLPSASSFVTTNDTKTTCTSREPVNVQTTDATVTTLDSFTVPSGSAVTCTWTVTGVKSDNSAAAGYSVAAVFVRSAGVTQVGSTTVTAIGESDSSWDVSVDNSGTTVRLRVKGAASTTVRWGSVGSVVAVIP